MTAEEMRARMDASFPKTIAEAQAKRGLGCWPSRPHGALPKVEPHHPKPSVLLKARLELGLSGQAFANLICVSVADLWRYENLGVAPRPGRRQKIADQLRTKARLEISPDDLLP